MLAGRRMNGQPVEVLRGGQVVTVQVPVDDALRATVRQLGGDEPGGAVQLPGEGDAGIHAGVDELQRPDAFFVVS